MPPELVRMNLAVKIDTAYSNPAAVHAAAVPGKQLPDFVCTRRIPTQSEMLPLLPEE